MNEDRRLIEDYLPIKAISKEASREKSVRKGHISTLHLWWARRPLVACRAAVYGALVPADQFRPKNGPPEKRKSLGRANAAKFLERLCKYPGNPQVIKEAQRHILEAHAERLTKETGKKVTLEDIEQGRAPRPRVLDMFAGGGAIPLEALRLGCEAYAIELNPVAHIIELCTLVYPQKYGKPDLNQRGMTGPKNDKGETTWGGLAEEVRYWGNWVLEQVRKEIGDLYPPIPDPGFKGKRPEIEFENGRWVEEGKDGNAIEEWAGINNNLPRGYLTPVAYLWTRTIQCKNPKCDGIVPLVRQTWLCKKKGRFTALKVTPDEQKKKVRFEVVEVSNENSLGFDPSLGSKRGNAPCIFCGTVADSEYVKSIGRTEGLNDQLIAIVASTKGSRGWVYLSTEENNINFEEIQKRTNTLLLNSKITIPNESIVGLPEDNYENRLGISVRAYGMRRFQDLFSPRQLLFHLHTVRAVKRLEIALKKANINEESRLPIVTMISCAIDRAVDFGCKLCVWNPYKDSGTTHAFGRQIITMVWDYSEVNPFNLGNASWHLGLERIVSSLSDALFDNPGKVIRGSATSLPVEDESVDAVVTDPPYYDNIPYADISDFFYVWLKRSIGHLYPDHFASILTPKKKETIADPYRYGGSKGAAGKAYEKMMLEAFKEAHRVLKKNGILTVVYAHKTTLGWATLLEALRSASFMVSEAWPLNTEKPGRLRAQESAALASSIFLVALKRDGSIIGQYEDDVRPMVQDIVRERVESLWEKGITGADLVIASVGAGLRPFTRFERVEYANGEEVPAERFLAEVETAVLDTILRRLSREVRTKESEFSLEGLDPVTRFYILWRYTYKYTVLDAGEAIVFANGTHVELDGPNGLSTRVRALLEKKKGKYRLNDYSDRGEDKKLGLMKENGQPAPVIDTLHRTLWLMENRPGELSGFLQETQPNREQMRLVAQALAGPALKGGELGDISPHAELSALAKLTANWKSVVEDAGVSPVQKKAEEGGQRRLF